MRILPCRLAMIEVVEQSASLGLSVCRCLFDSLLRQGCLYRFRQLLQDILDQVIRLRDAETHFQPVKMQIALMA